MVQLTSAGNVSMLVMPPNPPLIIKPATETTITTTITITITTITFVDFH